MKRGGAAGNGSLPCFSATAGVADASGGSRMIRSVRRLAMACLSLTLLGGCAGPATRTPPPGPTPPSSPAPSASRTSGPTPLTRVVARLKAEPRSAATVTVALTCDGRHRIELRGGGELAAGRAMRVRYRQNDALGEPGPGGEVLTIDGTSWQRWDGGGLASGGGYWPLDAPDPLRQPDSHTLIPGQWYGPAALPLVDPLLLIEDAPAVPVASGSPAPGSGSATPGADGAVTPYTFHRDLRDGPVGPRLAGWARATGTTEVDVTLWADATGRPRRYVVTGRGGCATTADIIYRAADPKVHLVPPRPDQLHPSARAATPPPAGSGPAAEDTPATGSDPAGGPRRTRRPR